MKITIEQKRVPEEMQQAVYDYMVDIMFNKINPCVEKRLRLKYKTSISSIMGILRDKNMSMSRFVTLCSPFRS